MSTKKEKKSIDPQKKRVFAYLSGNTCNGTDEKLLQTVLRPGGMTRAPLNMIGQEGATLLRTATPRLAQTRSH